MYKISVFQFTCYIYVRFTNLSFIFQSKEEEDIDIQKEKVFSWNHCLLESLTFTALLSLIPGAKMKT